MRGWLGVETSEYEVDQYGVVCRGTLYQHDGALAGTNGSSSLNKPL